MRRRLVAAGLALAVIGGCSRRDDPQAALDAAAQELQASLEAKKAGAVLELLHAEFVAQSELDRRWAERTMTLLFMQNANVGIVALSRSSRLDPGSTQVGYTDAQVVLSGGQGLLPDRAAPYDVKLEWRRDGQRWKLRKLDWT